MLEIFIAGHFFWVTGGYESHHWGDGGDIGVGGWTLRRMANFFPRWKLWKLWWWPTATTLGNLPSKCEVCNRYEGLICQNYLWKFLHVSALLGGTINKKMLKNCCLWVSFYHQAGLETPSWQQPRNDISVANLQTDRWTYIYENMWMPKKDCRQLSCWETGASRQGRQYGCS